MPVQAIVTAAQIAARKPHSPMRPPVSPKNTQPMPKIAAGTKVTTDMTPSRDSQEERHCEKARHARSGRPRWNAEETRPVVDRAKAVANATKPNPLLSGNSPSGTARPSNSNSANPAPDAVVKKTIDRAGCIDTLSATGAGRPSATAGWRHRSRVALRRSGRSAAPEHGPRYAAVLGALVGGAGRTDRDAGRLVAMQAGLWKMHGARTVALAVLEGMDAVEPHSPGSVAIGVEIRQRRHVSAGIPFLAGGGTGMAADAEVEIDDEAELFLAGIGLRQVGHSAASCCSSPPKRAP